MGTNSTTPNTSPTPHQQPPPVGTTSPRRRRLALIAFVVLLVLVAYHLFSPPSTTPPSTKSDDARETPASDQQIKAASATAAAEARQERERKERAEAMRQAQLHGAELAQGNNPTHPTTPGQQPAASPANYGGVGSGNGYRSSKHSASSIMFDTTKVQQLAATDVPRPVGGYAPGALPMDYRSSDGAVIQGNDRTAILAAIAARDQALRNGAAGAAYNAQPYLRGSQANWPANYYGAPYGDAGIYPDQSQPGAIQPPNAAAQDGQAPPQQQKAAVNLLKPDRRWPTTVLPEDFVIEGVLRNRLEGANDGPVAVMVTTNVYQRGTHHLIFPQGTVLSGETKRVSFAGQERLAVMFHGALVERLDGSMYRVPLDAPALDQTGAVALTGKVNHHYVQIFGASLAVGAVGGLANIGNTYGGLGGYSTLSSIRAGIGGQMGSTSEEIMSYYLNRLPTITIPEGMRVRIMLTGDLGNVPFFPDPIDEEGERQP